MTNQSPEQVLVSLLTEGGLPIEVRWKIVDMVGLSSSRDLWPGLRRGIREARSKITENNTPETRYLEESERFLAVLMEERRQ